MPQNVFQSGESKTTKGDAVAVTGLRLPVHAHARRGERDITVSVGHQAVTRRREGRLDRVAILVPLGSAECELIWSSDSGKHEEQAVVARQVCVIGMECPHRIAWRCAGDVAILRVGPGFLLDLPAEAMRRTEVYDLTVLAKGDVGMHEAARMLQSIAQNPAAHPPKYLESWGTVLATHVLRAHCGGTGRPKGKGIFSPAQLERLAHHIQTHMQHPLTVNDLSREVGLSAYHFIRTFKRTTGESPHQYLLRCRLERAHELLKTGNFRVSEVSNSVGFYDQSHLDRHFRRRFGIRPKDLLR